VIKRELARQLHRFEGSMNAKSKSEHIPSSAFVVATAEPATSTVLLNAEQLAQRLSVPPTWVREKTRERARSGDSDPLPVKRLGKYVRFSWPEVEAWLLRQGN